MSDLFGNDDDRSPQSLGGEVRAKNLSADERKAIARRAATARWENHPHILRATHGSVDRPLKIADMEIPCYVLEDGRRVLSLGGMVRSLGMSIGSGGGRQGDRLLQFATGKNISPYVSNDLISRMKGASVARPGTSVSATNQTFASLSQAACTKNCFTGAFI